MTDGCLNEEDRQDWRMLQIDFISDLIFGGVRNVSGKMVGAGDFPQQKEKL
jgi:hypothetical protein